MSEFNLIAIELGDGETEKLRAIRGPSVMIVTNGEGKMKASGKEYELKEGYVFSSDMAWERKYKPPASCRYTAHMLNERPTEGTMDEQTMSSKWRPMTVR